MLALYRSGRQAEALEAYQDARRALTDELGIEPSQQLRELQQAILRQDSSVERGPAVGALTAASTFVGREREVERFVRRSTTRSTATGDLSFSTASQASARVDSQRRHCKSRVSAGHGVLVGRCWEAGGAPAYWPWVQALRAYIHDCRQELLQAQLGPGAAELAQLLPELRELIPDLPEPSAPGSDGARLRLFDAVATLLKNIAQDQPLVLFFDDVHAADESSLLLLRFLAREPAHARLLVLAAYRDVDPTLRDPLRTTLSELVREPVTRRISLVGLVHDEIADYISMVARVEPEARAVAEIHAETAGNALFVGEIVRLLAAQGKLDAAGGSLEIPAGIREVIGSRVARLTEPCRKLLSIASVLGREFGVEVLQYLSDLPGETLYDALDEAMSERIIGDVPGAHNRLRFAHVLIRDTLYDDLTAARRMQRHREAAVALERAYGSELGPHLAEIALHFVAAVLSPLTLRWTTRGVRRVKPPPRWLSRRQHVFMTWR